MSCHVNLLLLLSALLSALTGVGGSVRGQDRARAVAEGSVAAARVAQVPRIATLRPVQRLATLVESARSGVTTELALTPREPAFAFRRRE
jgi:hypothetical protein